MAKKIESSKKKRLSALVVDDSRVCRMIHDAYLTRNDFETYTVENGREAVDLIRSGEQFDVIFMDLVMPVMNGFEATRELRAMGVTTMIVGIDCPIDLRDDPIQAGVDRVYEKPLTEEIIISVRQALQSNYNI
ncbi:hypothetical protein DCAR_0206458 [Daucus carota subsp. sativus]|uniref:Uncharacterized protein n=1 Tax=Daucus carota subsp. sativus TaxID=79200 RepID=A0A162ARQ0_DAUCS|nr:PREDICTED: two-component response regulator ORR42-like [Daucus carota subsp. sativus]WOG87235.1 hypothetical protein DCAR_0206458 [Daucus carota subsp. sativus]